MTTSEKVAYLKGLAEGLGIGKDSREDKLFSAIIDILGDLASDVEDLEAYTEDLSEGLDAVSEDLELLEDAFYDDCDEHDDCCCGEYDDDCCCSHDCCCDDPMFYEVTCPACDNTITVDEDVIALGKIQCPNCGEMLEFVVDECCGEDGCCCGEHDEHAE
ncbi:MAG: hypothetical protein KIG37_04020 [Oscillospiraceae bacterium]|nr:hypothetical protein [Oscillospiraceae bacterium]